jgi:hypothetical protein
LNREQVLARLEKAWRELHDSYAGLSHAQLMIPGVTGNWSVKDILAHISTWEEEALKSLPVILAGHRPPTYRAQYGGINGFNALMTEKKRGLSLSEVLRQLDEIHRRLMDYLNTAPEELFAHETRFRRRLRLDTYSHYPIHAAAIRAWRQKQRESAKDSLA